jgi:hypothetical protein
LLGILKIPIDAFQRIWERLTRSGNGYQFLDIYNKSYFPLKKKISSIHTSRNIKCQNKGQKIVIYFGYLHFAIDVVELKRVPACPSDDGWPIQLSFLIGPLFNLNCYFFLPVLFRNLSRLYTSDLILYCNG